MKKILIIIPVMLLLLTGCEMEEQNISVEETTEQTTKPKGHCLEYRTKYELECGLFTCDNSLCCERKYDVCIRWED